MANIISYKDIECSCSNGCMSVLMTVIGLSGSSLAQKDYEKNLIIWLMEKDQSYVGIGTVGFDITEMPWNRKHFDKQKHFMLHVLEGVMNKTGWSVLSYEPNTDIIFNKILRLREMFMQVTQEDIDFIEVGVWFYDTKCGKAMEQRYLKCQKHGIYLSVFGCIACNDC